MALGAAGGRRAFSGHRRSRPRLACLWLFLFLICSLFAFKQVPVSKKESSCNGPMPASPVRSVVLSPDSALPLVNRRYHTDSPQKETLHPPRAFLPRLPAPRFLEKHELESTGFSECVLPLKPGHMHLINLIESKEHRGLRSSSFTQLIINV